MSETAHPGAPPFPVSHPASTQSAPHGHTRCTPRDWPRSPSPSCHGKAQPKGSQSSAGQPPARHCRHGEQPLRMALAGQQKGQNWCGHVGLLLGMGRNARLPAGPHESPGLTSPGVVLALCLLHGENALHRNVPACGVLSTASFSPRGRPLELSQMEWQPRSLPCPAMQVLPLLLPLHRLSCCSRRSCAEGAPEDVPALQTGFGGSSKAIPQLAGGELVWLLSVLAPGGEGHPP